LFCHKILFLMGGMMDKKRNYAVWATQGGGLVRETGGIFIFIEPPEWGFQVGDEMPEEWGIAPANDAAQAEWDD
jgi:hypothetical protein